MNRNPETGRSFVIVGASLTALATLLYSFAESFMLFFTPERAAFFAQLAYAYLSIMLVGGGLVVLGLRRVVAERMATSKSQGYAALQPGWILPYVLSLGRFRSYFVVSASVYGLFYAFVTSIIVYQPTVDFVQAYHAALPSVLVGPCCGPPLYSPILTVYLANHFGLLVVPLTAILLVMVSTLVGLNVALSAFAFSRGARSMERGWVGGLGAAVGLFTGCPTCAGLFFANFVGGAGAVSLAAILSYYQPVFIALSVPVLVATLYLISRSLSKVFKDGCVVIGGNGSGQARSQLAPSANHQ